MYILDKGYKMKTKTGIIPFRDTEIVTSKVNDVIYVALKPIVNAMGLDWRRQSQKIQDDQRYGHMSIPYETRGGKQEMLSLEIYQLPAFLYSINPNKVREDLREKIIAFQNETFKVINEYWNGQGQIRELTGRIGGLTYTKNIYEKQIAELKQNIQTLSLNLEKMLEENNSLKSLPNYSRQFISDDMSLNEKVDFLIRQTEEELKNAPNDDNLAFLWLQKRVTYFLTYVKAMRTGGSELQRFTADMIEDAQKRRNDAENKFLNLEEHYKKIKECCKSIEKY